MANFAPAYHQKSNLECLNTLIAEVIDPNQRANCRAYGRDWDDDMVDDPDYESSNDDAQDDLEKQSDGGIICERSVSSPPAHNAPASAVPSRASSLCTSRSRSKSSRKKESPVLNAFYHAPRKLSQRSASASDTRQMQDGSEQVLVSPMSAFISNSISSTEQESDGRRILEDGTSTKLISPLSLGGYAHRSSPNRRTNRRSRPVISPETVPESPAPPYEEAEKTLIPRPPRIKALHRSISSQGWEAAPHSNLRRQLSTLSELSAFAPHPAVRPLENRKVLGEAAGPSDDDSAQYPAPLPLALIITGICLSVFVISLDRNIITTAIPEITARFHSYDDIGWYGSAYLLTASAFQPLYGRIYMSFETKSSFLSALTIFELGSLVAALAPSSSALIVGRAIQGLGSAGILTGSFVVGTHSVRLQKRPVLFACVGILYGVGALCGPLLGGAFTDTIGWRWCFWINLPVGLVTFISVFFFFHRRQPTSSERRASFVKRLLCLDLVGNVILLGATTMLFLALQFSEQRNSWTSARVIGLLVGFGLTTLLFIGWLFYKGDSALLPPRIILQRTVAASCVAAFLIYGTTLIHAYYLPIWFQAIKGSSAIHSGVNMIPYMCANATFSLLAGIFVSKNGLFAPPAILGCAIGTVGCGLLATLNPRTSTATWVSYQILTSAGIGLAIQQGFSAVQTALPLEEVPIGTAAVVAAQSVGGAVFISVGNTLLQNHLLNQNNVDAIPGVDVRAVVVMGATNFRRFVDPVHLPALVRLYSESMQAVFVAAVPLCGVAFLASLCMEWKSVKGEEGNGGEKGKREREMSEA